MPRLPARFKETRIVLSPHVVVLGAGASRAAFPKGDRNGRKLPLMNDLVSTLGLERILSGIETPLADPTRGFEAMYAELASNCANAPVLAELQNAIFSYFDQMVLPNEVTLYDRLLLALRQKDFIATFNWDPLLLQAYRRNLHLRQLPVVVFLHGCVGMGVCYDCKSLGYANTVCERCHRRLENVKLLYPISRKNYAEDEVIADQWHRFRDALSEAYQLTIFGYSAPVSDEEATDTMKESWRDSPLVELSDVEIINTAGRKLLETSWNPFFVRTHYLISDTFQHSSAMKYARRSCEALFQASLMNDPIPDDPMPRFKNLESLWKWVQPLIDEEVKAEQNGSDFTLMPHKP